VALHYEVASSIATGSLLYLDDVFVKGWFNRRGKTVD
tara:strand:- start:19134 stop:19244 length:111 start_codon:yes stop_codon:yes gene_type:complete